jgi:oligoendopeptidase F
MTENTMTAGTPVKADRKFLPANYKISDWNSLEPYYTALTEKNISSKNEMIQWLNDLSELEAAVEEHAGWLYIRMTCDTKDKKLTEAYTYFVEQVNPQIEPYADKLNKKLFDSPFAKELDSRYELYLKGVENEIKLFREENIPVEAELTVKEQQYGEIAGAMTVDLNLKTLTLQHY